MLRAKIVRDIMTTCSLLKERDTISVAEAAEYVENVNPAFVYELCNVWFTASNYKSDEALAKKIDQLLEENKVLRHGMANLKLEIDAIVERSHVEEYRKKAIIEASKTAMMEPTRRI